MMLGLKHDIHHIRKFDALEYVHIPITPGRTKQHTNAKIGYALGYAEDTVGCKMYFPEDHTAKFVTDLRVEENIVYQDRYDIALGMDKLASLEFSHEDENGDDERESLGSGRPCDDIPDIHSMNHGYAEGVSDITGNTRQQTAELRTEHSDDNSKEDVSVTADAKTREASDDALSDVGTCGSSVADEELVADQSGDEISCSMEGSTVSSVFAFGNDGNNEDDSLETDVRPDSNRQI